METKHRKILIVDDIYINRYMLNIIINGYGDYQTHFAETGEQAINIIKKIENFDLVFMDVKMPVLDGDEATKIIKNDLKLNVPVIAVTVYDNSSYDVSVFNDIIRKPYSTDKIKEMLNKYKDNEKFN